MIPIPILITLFKSKALGVLGAILPWMKKHWKEILIGLFIAWFAWSYHNLKEKNEELRTDIVEFESKIKEYERVVEKFATNEVKYLNTISKQNKSIDDYKTSAEGAKEALEEAKINAARTKSEYEKLIDELQDTPPPVECHGAMDWILDRAIEGKARRGNNE